MKKIAFLLLTMISTTAFSQINWISFEEAMAKSSQDGKPVLIDVYTDWCGWCKRLDATTYQDPAVIEYVNSHFHAVKLDAETKAPIKYRSKVYTNTGKTHDLASHLLKGQLSYPTTIFMVDDIDFIAPVAGYMNKEGMRPYLLYFGEKVYDMNNSWEIFQKGLNAKKL